MTMHVQDRGLDSLVLDLLEWVAAEPRTYTPRLVRVPEPRVARHHLRSRERGAEAPAELTERAVGHARHRREQSAALQLIASNLHVSPPAPDRWRS